MAAPHPEAHAGVMLLDGGVGHELKRRGCTDRQLWSARALIDHGTEVTAVHREFLAAGCDVVTTNTYACSPLHLARLSGGPARLEELLEIALECAHTARVEADRPDALIAGSLPPLDESYRADLVRSSQELGEWYGRMVEAMAPAVDTFICETMSSTTEAAAAIGAASRSGNRVWASWTLAPSENHAARLRSGETIAAAAQLAAETGVDAILVNCSSVDLTNDAVGQLATRGLDRFGAYANAFDTLPTHIEAMPPADIAVTNASLAAHCASWVERGARIIGGCCGVDAVAMSAIAAAVRARQK